MMTIVLLRRGYLDTLFLFASPLLFRYIHLHRICKELLDTPNHKRALIYMEDNVQRVIKPDRLYMTCKDIGYFIDGN
jgi:hypothetical protein